MSSTLLYSFYVVYHADIVVFVSCTCGTMRFVGIQCKGYILLKIIININNTISTHCCRNSSACELASDFANSPSQCTANRRYKMVRDHHIKVYGSPNGGNFSPRGRTKRKRTCLRGWMPTAVTCPHGTYHPSRQSPCRARLQIHRMQYNHVHM